MDRNILWKCTGVVMMAVIRMCLNTQSEESYEMRNSMLMKFTPTVTGREEISFNVAACEHGLRGLSRVRDMCSECRWRSVVRELCSDVCSRQVGDSSLQEPEKDILLTGKHNEGILPFTVRFSGMHFTVGL